MQRGRLDNTPDVVSFAESLEKACIDTVNIDGIMTKDLAVSCSQEGKYVMTTDFMVAVGNRLKDNVFAKAELKL